MNIYDFGLVELHTYRTNDFISAAVLIVKKNGKAVIIEAPCFLHTTWLTRASYPVFLYKQRQTTMNRSQRRRRGASKNFTGTFGSFFDNSIYDATTL